MESRLASVGYLRPAWRSHSLVAVLGILHKPAALSDTAVS